MIKKYLIYFLKSDKNGDWFELDESNQLLPVSQKDFDASERHSDTEFILILPSEIGIPFCLKLPFGEVGKIEKVLPQLVADEFHSVKSDWLFSWKTLKLAEDGDKSSWSIFGLAFSPEFSEITIGKDNSWALAIPDLWLLSSDFAGKACNLISPVGNRCVVFSADGSLQAVLSEDGGLPVQSYMAMNSIENLQDFDLSKALEKFRSKIEELIEEPEKKDLSGVKARQGKKVVKLLAAAAFVLIIGITLIYHFFLWGEGIRYEIAANRVSQNVNKVFAELLPGIPVVEPVSQIKRTISEAEATMKSAADAPNFNVASILKILVYERGGTITLESVKGEGRIIRVVGTSGNYQDLNVFKEKLSKSDFFGLVEIKESSMTGNSLRFVLEGRWKN